jgi:hypothetical protein
MSEDFQVPTLDADAFNSEKYPGLYEEVSAKFQAAADEIAGRKKALASAREFERKYKRYQAVLGDTAPERLKELMDADQRSAEIEQNLESRLLEERQRVEREKQAQLDEVRSEADKARDLAAQVTKRYDVFRAYNQKGGLPPRFESFAALSEANISYDKEGSVEIRDDAGKLLTFKPKDLKEQERKASLEDFIEMVSSGGIDEYKFQHAEAMKLCMEVYNGSSGSGLPSINGSGSSSGDWKSLSGDALWQGALPH